MKLTFENKRITYVGEFCDAEKSQVDIEQFHLVPLRYDLQSIDNIPVNSPPNYAPEFVVNWIEVRVVRWPQISKSIGVTSDHDLKDY